MSAAQISTSGGPQACPICAHLIAVEEDRCAACGWHTPATDGIAGSAVRTNELWVLIGAFVAVYAAVFAIVAATQ